MEVPYAATGRLVIYMSRSGPMHAELFLASTEYDPFEYDWYGIEQNGIGQLQRATAQFE